MVIANVSRLKRARPVFRVVCLAILATGASRAIAGTLPPTDTGGTTGETLSFRPEQQNDGRADRSQPQPLGNQQGDSGVDLPKSVSQDGSLARLDDVYGWRGWDIPFPSYGDTLLQDYGGWRSDLAKAGIGILGLSENVFSANVLDRPHNSPTYNPYYKTRQNYEGQRASYYNIERIFLTYDLGKIGIPGGQFQFAGAFARSTYQGFAPNQFGLNALAYYQTLFHKKIELRIGYYPAAYDFEGQFIGGNFASTTGIGGSIPVLLGLTASTSLSPTARITIHATKNLYEEFAVLRSDPVTGPTGNPFFDGVKQNPVGLKWSLKSVPGTGTLYINEIGYKKEAAPGSMKVWIRAALLYNTSQFQDFSRLSDADGANARRKGSYGAYIFADRQLWQQAPDDAKTAYRGVYAGLTAEYAPARKVPVTQYYEGRVYWIGALDSRPEDMLSLVYYHQVNSRYLIDAVNQGSSNTGSYGWHRSDSTTVSYTAHVAKAVFGTMGLGYTNHPTPTYFGPSLADTSQRREGDALNIDWSVVVVF